MHNVLTLKNRADFLRISAMRISYGQDAFLLLAAPKTTPTDGIHIGYTVTKKIGNAVVRNRIKRRLREAAREALPRASNGKMDYVLIARPAAVSLPYSTLTESLIFAVSKVDKKAHAKEYTPHATPD